MNQTVIGRLELREVTSEKLQAELVERWFAEVMLSVESGKTVIVWQDPNQPCWTVLVEEYKDA